MLRILLFLVFACFILTYLLSSDNNYFCVQIIINFLLELLGSERDDDDEYLRPNKVAILNQNRSHSNHYNSKKISTFKSSYHGGNQFHKSWQGKAHLVREQLNSEFSHRNRQRFKNK